MKIYEFCPFFNENRVAELKIHENSNWVDELHIAEADKTFSNADKPYNFNTSHINSKVVYHKINAGNIFRNPLKHQLYFNPGTCTETAFDRWYWRLLSYNSAFQNEAAQRNLCTDFLRQVVNDEDIVILSDFDEILDSRLADRLVSEVKRRQVITVKFYYSVFYLNLFCASNHGAPDWSYRIFIMTGRFFRSMPFTSDYLRKKGIAGGLSSDFYCLNEFSGFHHSWLEYKNTAFQKLKAFEANVEDKGIINAGYIDKCLRNKKLYYIDSELYSDDNKNFLSAVHKLDTQDLWYKDK